MNASSCTPLESTDTALAELGEIQHIGGAGQCSPIGKQAIKSRVVSWAERDIGVTS